MKNCTAKVTGGPTRGTVCNRTARTWNHEGEPRCGWHSRDKSTPSGEFQVEPELVTCTLQCTCGVVSDIALAGDMPARAALASLSCPACKRVGALAFARNRKTG